MILSGSRIFASEQFLIMRIAAKYGAAKLRVSAQETIFLRKKSLPNRRMRY
jgi:hypothetical protein